MPPSPLEAHISNTKRVLFSDDGNTFFKNDVAYSSAASKNAGAKKVKFHSQPITTAAGFDEAVANGYFPPRPQFPPRNPKINKLRDGRYNSFKTWSGKLERQLSHLRGKSRLSESEEEIPQKTEVKNLHVDRYFDALEGPELDTLRVCAFYFFYPFFLVQIRVEKDSIPGNWFPGKLILSGRCV